MSGELPHVLTHQTQRQGWSPYSDSLGSFIMNQLYWRGTGRIYWR